VPHVEHLGSVASLLAATLYQGNHDRNHKLWNIGSADIYIYIYILHMQVLLECCYIWLLKNNEKKVARSFNFTFCYIDDVLSLNNSKLGDFVDLIYPIEL
jgi:hypothetical protein